MRMREADERDSLAVAEVAVETWRATYGGIVPDDFLAGLSVEQRDERQRQEWTRPGLFVLVAEDEREGLVGFVVAGPERQGHPNYRGELHALYVLPAFQRYGLGRDFVSAAATRLLADGQRSLLTWVLEKSPARPFYEALGGSMVGQQSITIGGAELVEIAYGWDDAQTLIAPLRTV